MHLAEARELGGVIGMPLCGRGMGGDWGGMGRGGCECVRGCERDRDVTVTVT